MDIKLLLASHGSHSKAFRSLFDSGDVRSNFELITLLSRESGDFPDHAAITIVSWNRGTRPDRAGIGLSDEMLDEVLAVSWPIEG